MNIKKNKIRLFLVTERFPFFPGEDFLENEIKTILFEQQIELTIFPLKQGTKKRDIANQLKIDDRVFSFSKKISKFKKLYLLIISAILTKSFYKELFSDLFFKKPYFNFIKIKTFINSFFNFAFYSKIFNAILKKEKNFNNLVIYTYWHNEAAYALQTLKKDFNFIFISRIHGYDLYKERYFFSYLPLKKNFLTGIDRLFTVSDSAKNYISSNFGYETSTIETARLGIENMGIICLPSGQNIINIVSCSYISEIKRLDKIIKSIHKSAILNPKIKFNWFHIGGFHCSEKYAEKISNLCLNMLSNIKNIHYEFKGNMKNSDIFNFYRQNSVDIFINTSESEGTPVSMMEAMSCHIPLIAPAIGGIPEMVFSGYNGILISPGCCPDLIAEHIGNIDFFKNKTIRENSYKVYKKNFTIQNYNIFLKSVKEICL